MPLCADSSSVPGRSALTAVRTRKLRRFCWRKKEKEITELYCTTPVKTQTVSANRPEFLSLSETEISISENVIQPGFSRAIERHRRGPSPHS